MVASSREGTLEVWGSPGIYSHSFFPSSALAGNSWATHLCPHLIPLLELQLCTSMSLLEVGFSWSISKVLLIFRSTYFLIMRIGSRFLYMLCQASAMSCCCSLIPIYLESVSFVYDSGEVQAKNCSCCMPALPVSAKPHNSPSLY